MEFWGIEVKPGQNVKYDPEDKLLHLSQASLGETKGKGNENVLISVKINDQKLVLGTLSAERCSQISFDIAFEKDFELSHTSKNTSVYFCGYKVPLHDEQSDSDLETDSEDDLSFQNVNGNANDLKNKNSAAASKAKKAEPAKVEKDEDDEDDDDDDDDEDLESDKDMPGAMSDSDSEDEEENSDEEDEATPMKVTTGKRPAESASKTPAPEKKAKIATPAGGQKTGGDGKKVVHVATPHPAKQTGKTPANSDKSKPQTPNTAGSVACKSCSKTFKSEIALQSHTKAKHG